MKSIITFQKKDFNITFILIYFILLFITQYISSILPVLIYITYILLYLAIVLKFPKYLLKYSTIPFLLLMLGIFSISTSYNLRDILRDIFYFGQALLALIFGYFIAYKINNLSKLFKSIIYIAISFAIIHFIMIILSPGSYLANLQISFNRIGHSSIVPIGLSFLLINLKYKLVHFRKVIVFIFLFLLISSLLLTFSRTNTVTFILFTLFALGIIRLKIKNIFVILLLSFMTFVIFLYLSNNEGLYSQKILHSIEEITIRNYTSMHDINLNWRGFEAYKGLMTYLNDGNTFDKIFGYGFGKTISLGFSMELAGAKYTTIPILHNGFIFLLVKTGLLGIMMYIGFLFFLFISNYHTKLLHGSYFSIQNLIIKQLIAAISIVILSQTLVVGGWTNVDIQVTFIALLGILLQFKQRYYKSFRLEKNLY